MRKTLKYPLYRSKRNKHLIRQIWAAASIWNHSVALTRRYYRMYGKHLSAYRLMKHNAKLRRRNPYWKRLGSQATQEVVQRLDKSYQRFFSDAQAGRPHFKKRSRYSSFTLKQAGWKLLSSPEDNPKQGRLRVGKKTYKFVKSRPVEGEIKTVTIKRDRCGTKENPSLWVCFSVVTEEETETTDVTSAVGFDFGLKTFLVGSDGSAYKAPQHLKTSLDEMRERQRSLSRKKKGSNNRRKARLRVAKLHRRIANQRRDWHFKLAHTLCDKADAVCLEDLNVKAMQRLWGRKISDLGFAAFVKILEHVARKRGVHVEKVDRFYASTKTCHTCGEKTDLGLSQRQWRCRSCGSEHDRDFNAARNIRREGASSLGLGNVRPAETEESLGTAVAV